MKKLLSLMVAALLCLPGPALAASVQDLTGEWYREGRLTQNARGEPAVLVECWILDGDMVGTAWYIWHDPATKEELSSSYDGFQWSLEGGRFHHMMGRQKDEWWDAGYELSGNTLTIGGKVFHRDLVWPLYDVQPTASPQPTQAPPSLPQAGERSFFGRYDYSMHYINEVSGWTAFLYGSKNWLDVVSAVFSSDLSGRSVEEEFMHQPARAKSLLKTVLNRMLGRSIETHKDASVAIKRVKAIQRLADTLLKIDLPLEGIQEISEYIKYSNIAKDYTKDFASHYLLLDTLIRVTPRNSHIRDIAKELMEDYATASARELAKKWASGTLMLLTATAGGDSIVQGLLAGVPALDTLDTVIGLSVLKHNAYEVLEAHGDRMREDGQPDPEDEETYELLFHLCRELTLMEYEAMKTHYKWNSAEAAFLQQEIESLKQTTPDNRIPAGRFQGN